MANRGARIGSARAEFECGRAECHGNHGKQQKEYGLHDRGPFTDRVLTARMPKQLMLLR
jgi:hypothetical protein